MLKLNQKLRLHKQHLWKLQVKLITQNIINSQGVFQLIMKIPMLKRLKIIQKLLAVKQLDQVVMTKLEMQVVKQLAQVVMTKLEMQAVKQLAQVIMPKLVEIVNQLAQVITLKLAEIVKQLAQVITPKLEEAANQLGQVLPKGY